MTELPFVTPLVFEGEPRRVSRRGSSYQITVPVSWAENVPLKQNPEAFAVLMQQYLIFYPAMFQMSNKRQLLDIAMTALEALAMIDSENKEKIAEAWKKLKEREDVYELEEF